jgi:SAM-dependent methyltransferase
MCLNVVSFASCSNVYTGGSRRVQVVLTNISVGLTRKCALLTKILGIGGEVTNFFLGLLKEPQLAGLDIDSDERMLAHRIVLERKSMLKAVFAEINDEFKSLADRYFLVDGEEVELGAGVAPMRDKYPEVLATDIVPAAHLDMELDAGDMNLADASVKAFYAQNCFHHFPNPGKFFLELERTLKSGGGAIILEPYHGLLASFMFKRLFSTEGYDKDFQSWETPAEGPMNGANQALCYLVFVRDRKKFEFEHPGLEIVHQSVMGNYLKYLFSGGLNFRQLLPNWTTPTITALEKLLTPFRPLLGLHQIVVLRKVDL